MLPGWKSPCTSVSGHPAGGDRGEPLAAARRPGPAGPPTVVVVELAGGAGHQVRSTAGTNGPARQSGAPTSASSCDPVDPVDAAARRACRAPAAAPAAARPSGPRRARRPAAPADLRPRSAAARRSGPAGRSIAPSWPKNGGTTLSQAGPAAVGSRQTLERFQVLTWTAGAGPGPARGAAAVRRPRRGRAAGPPGRAYGSRSGWSSSGSAASAGHGASCSGGGPRRPPRGR